MCWNTGPPFHACTAVPYETKTFHLGGKLSKTQGMKKVEKQQDFLRGSEVLCSAGKLSKTGSQQLKIAPGSS